MDTGINITRSDLGPAPRVTSARSPRGWHPSDLPQAMFGDAVIRGGLAHLAQESFPGECTAEGLQALGTAMLVRADRSFNEVEAVLRLRSGAVALIDSGYGQVQVDVAGGSRDVVVAGAASVRGAFENEAPADERVSFAFWMRGRRGGEVRRRQVEAPLFSEIELNYPAGVRSALLRLMGVGAPDCGRLILWRGDPGTGKSHALRALARAWAPWCSAHFVIDPEELLGESGAYMLDVLSWEGDDDGRWRLLILEDAGELIASDARAVAGRALSRLLNVADGLLGQGTRTLLLITTNEPVKRLHPATRRPGRCLADIEFCGLSVPEARAWLAARGVDALVDRPLTLAELFARVHGEPVQAEVDEGRRLAFGFGRVLDSGKE